MGVTKSEIFSAVKLTVGFLIFIVIIHEIADDIISSTSGSQKGINITIREKWAMEDGSFYLFSDTNGSIYSIQNSLIKGVFNSAERYAQIQKGRNYRIETFGKRSHLPENYPNAIRIEEV